MQVRRFRLRQALLTFKRGECACRPHPFGPQIFVSAPRSHLTGNHGIHQFMLYMSHVLSEMSSESSEATTHLDQQESHYIAFTIREAANQIAIPKTGCA